MAAGELVFDPGVLAPTPTGEWGGWRAAAHTGGAAIVPWRRDWLAARREGVEAHPDARDLDAQRRFTQCLVHLQKSREATWSDLAAAWQRLEPGGRLLLAGGNELGIVSAVKRLARELDQPARVVANRRRARIVLFDRDRDAGPEPPGPAGLEIDLGDGQPRWLATAPGVFSAHRLDPGTELLLGQIEALGRAPRRILDMGCGIGTLGLAALLRWPGAHATLADADARAIECARANARALGVSDRCTLAWWDAEEPVPATGCDAVLLNPPFHAGKTVDLRPAHAMFTRLAEALAPGGTALIVANRTLPYERALADLGRVERPAETRHYKVLSFRRRSRSDAESGR